MISISTAILGILVNTPGRLNLSIPAAKSPPKIILIPLDSRPAAGQFGEMIAAMAGVKVEVPPTQLLGRFTNAGDSNAILSWLEQQDFSNVDSIIASADMVAYGGLVASRVNEVSASLAMSRLKRLFALKNRPNFAPKLYVFASNMRLAPTATIETAPYRMNLAKYEELKDRWERTKDPLIPAKLENLRKVLKPWQIEQYERTRARNFEVLKGLVGLAQGPEMDYLIMGQDDAKPDGPHIQENALLKKQVSQQGTEGKIYFCEGIDQHANILISRALLSRESWTPVVKVVYSDPFGKERYALYESKTIEHSLADQLYASGARMARPGEDFDYTLYLNSPKRPNATFTTFLRGLTSEVDQGFPVAVADINFNADGTSDEKLFRSILEQGRAFKLLAFAGWNTAGNTMGTSIPAANVYLLSRRLEVDPLVRELAQREFVLHRMVDDYAYHKYTRPEAYRMIDRMQKQRDEILGDNFETVNGFVERDLYRYINLFFAEQFLHKTFFAGAKEYRISGISNVSAGLPWPRAYEAEIRFKLVAEEIFSEKKR